jgi:hypothetical protein
MHDLTITIPADFLLDFLGALRPEGTRQVAIVGTIKDDVIQALMAHGNELRERGERLVNGLLTEDAAFISVKPVASMDVIKPRKKHVISASGKARIAAAQRKRWAKAKRNK